MRYKVKPDRIKLLDSYKVSKYDMFTELELVKMETFGSEVWKRSLRSLYFEWVCHNALYALGISCEKTKDVDLDCHPKWYMSMLYSVLGLVAWIFIK